MATKLTDSTLRTATSDTLTHNSYSTLAIFVSISVTRLSYYVAGNRKPIKIAILIY